MAEYEWKRLSRRELLEMLISEVEENESLLERIGVLEDIPEEFMDKLEVRRQMIKKELFHLKYWRVLRSTIGSLVVVAAAAVLIATLCVPVLRIYGTSMAPTLDEDEIVVSIKDTDLESGDLVAFYLGNKLLIKRCIAGPGEWVDMDDYGNVYVNDNLLEEPYLEKKALGECSVDFPYQIPENRFFLMGDHRETSVDSRSTVVGCVAEEQIVGKIVYRVWPFKKFGPLG